MDYSESLKHDEVKSFRGKEDKLFHTVRGMKLARRLVMPIT